MSRKQSVKERRGNLAFHHTVQASLRRAVQASLVLLAMGTTTAGAAERAAEQTPHDGCYTDREVLVNSTARGIKIAGTLSMPAGAGPHPAVLMITGNGPHTRDQMISNSPMFAMIADHLARRGLAVLRTDARGYGASTGPNDWELYTTQDRVEDNRAVFEFLKRQPGIDPKRMVLFGHSEGALIAASLAASGAHPALTVLLSTSALPGNDVFAQQRADNLRRRGATEEAVSAVHRELLRFADFLAHDRDNRPRFEALALDFLEAHGVPKKDLDPKMAQGLLEGYLKAPWYWHFVATDPRDDLKRIDTPLLAVFAGMDENVPWRRHLPALIGALVEAGNQNFATVVLPDQDHFFLEFEGHRMEKHRPGYMEIADELYAVLDAELGRRGLTQPACTAPGGTAR
jgi:pimeloyl-ACP methyl ester carboxylesterase